MFQVYSGDLDLRCSKVAIAALKTAIFSKHGAAVSHSGARAENKLRAILRLAVPRPFSVRRHRQTRATKERPSKSVRGVRTDWMSRSEEHKSELQSLMRI